jgi:hypothetical protein
MAYKKVALHVTFSAGTKPLDEVSAKKVTAKQAHKPHIRDKDVRYFSACMSEGVRHHQQGRFIEALAQFTRVINAPGAAYGIKAEACHKRAALYEDLGKPNKAQHDRQLATQLMSKV